MNESHSLGIVVEAARRWSNPNIKAAAAKLASNGKLRPLAHIKLTELPGLYETIAEEVVEAALE